MSPLVSCPEALASIQLDPLGLPAPVAAHLERCPACQEARIAWLAQAEAPLALVPAGYFDHLPARVLGKLPSAPRPARPWLTWAAAAGLCLAVGAGGFLLGLNRKPGLVEATLTTPVPETYEILPDTPFQAEDEAGLVPATQATQAP